MPNWFDSYDGVDEKVVVYKVIRCLAEFEFGFEGFGDGELSDAGESVEEEYARWW
jgi:hypothetical protein